MADEISAGEQSDHLVVRWDLSALSRPSFDDADVVGVCIPRDRVVLRTSDRMLASESRAASAEALTRCFEARFVVTGFDAQRESGRPRYTLRRPSEPGGAR